ncbi:MAG TPA: nuclear transport factor 2 family protein [Flavobacteriales bacterium]|jgi:hypothetical protein|nr:nuclear transport factor 2 family protein [Flavobacteriales bacterium]HIN41050.1 nuclear transport factor 2 family protein [Flavobacteriales bacterium]HIO15986.1 nuclear transport factor 2 family protein [Flavobacteriales bacterium]HIO58689.1 nuclear transport factor 2 family protein [Flavobacteriales bacterium]
MKTLISLVLYTLSFAPLLGQIQVDGMPQSAANIMFRQQESWNAGDLEGFMLGYWNSDNLLFIGGSGVTSGYDATLERYLKGYPDKESMGHLVFTNRSWTPLGRNYALLVGEWRLGEDVGGMYSLVWHKIKREWLIIADHSSSE